MDRFANLETFVRVARLASFTRAADELGSSRARVSQQVAALERHLGQKLLTRTTRRVTLTAEGSDYFARAQRILDELAAADEAVRGAKLRPQGRLRIEVPEAFGRYLLVPALGDFTRQYPDLQLEVRLNDRVVDLVAEGVDVALRVGRITQGGLVARRIARLSLVTCASPVYLARAGVPGTPADLARHRCIGALVPETGRLARWSFRMGGARQRVAVACQVSFNSPEAAISAGLADHGVLQTVDMMVARLLGQGRLQAVLEDYAAEGPAMSVVYPEALRGSLKVRVFAEFAERIVERWRARIAPP